MRQLHSTACHCHWFCWFLPAFQTVWSTKDIQVQGTGTLHDTHQFQEPQLQASSASTIAVCVCVFQGLIACPRWPQQTNLFQVENWPKPSGSQNTLPGATAASGICRNWSPANCWTPAFPTLGCNKISKQILPRKSCCSQETSEP